MKLKLYLLENHSTYKEFAEIVDCNPRYLANIDKGFYVPSSRLAKAIEKATDGKVVFAASDKGKIQRKRSPIKKIFKISMKILKQRLKVR